MHCIRQAIFDEYFDLRSKIVDKEEEEISRMLVKYVDSHIWWQVASYIHDNIFNSITNIKNEAKNV